MKEFDKNLYKVKGVFVQDESDPVVCGFYYVDEYNRNCIIDDDFGRYETNPYTLCRNTGVKVGDEYLYEYDVVCYTPPLSNKTCYGFVDFDEWYKGYMIRTGVEQRSAVEIKNCCNIKTTGKNIILSDDDYDWFAKWEKSEFEKSKGTPIDNSYCPSKFRR